MMHHCGFYCVQIVCLFVSHMLVNTVGLDFVQSGSNGSHYLVMCSRVVKRSRGLISFSVHF